MRKRWRWLLIALGLLLLPLVLFLINGLLLAHGETVLIQTTAHPTVNADEVRLVKILAYNIAKGFAHKSGLEFEQPAIVEARLKRMAEVIQGEDPDLVFLSETILECGPCPVNQVRTLAEATGMHTWAFGENYNLGVPFYRIVGGNAILSRWPLEPVANISLSGRRPFYVSRNNRRALWCAVRIAGRRVLLASLHNDSFDIDNNLAQTRQLLDFAEEQESILAGDFNALPEQEPIRLLERSGRFSGAFAGPPTYPTDGPDRRIDYILAPASWTLFEERVLPGDASDHFAVVATFRFR